jgi:hypothetical protein
MARSIRFRQLEARVTELRRHLIPPPSSTGAYTQRQYDRVRGYRLLVHAEIESCLEDRVVELVDRVCASWKVDLRPRTVVAALLAYHDTQFPPAPVSILKPAQNPSLDSIEARVEKARNAFSMKARVKNHGIREENVLGLLLPVGIRLSELDQTWLSTIDSYGRSRGETAHSAGRTQQPPDPVSEVATVRQLIQGLKGVDALIARLMAE